MSAPYLDLIREMKDAYHHGFRLVAHARQHGIKATARVFQTTLPRVRKWLRRYGQQGPAGLLGHSRAPPHGPHKTPRCVERQVIQLRRQLPTFGAARLKREFSLTPSHKAIQRIWRAHGLIHKRQKKYPRQQDLAHIQATGRLLQQISAHTKDRNDMPRYWPQAQRLRLPRVQYTAQCRSQWRVGRAHAAASGPLRRPAPRSGLANR